MPVVTPPVVTTSVPSATLYTPAPLRPAYVPKTKAAWHEEWAERAAIIEYQGGVSRGVAEQRARAFMGPIP